jgi:hypothetical protein
MARALLVAVALSVGCAGARAAAPGAAVAPVDPTAPIEQPTRIDSHWVPGERIMWHVSFRGIPLVRAILAVGQPGELAGVRTIIVKSRLEGLSLVAAVVDFRVEMQSWIDLDLGKPTRLDVEANVGDERDWATIRFAPGRIDRTYSRKGREPRTKTRTLPNGARTHDVHSLLGFLRGWAPKAGTHAEIRHFDDSKLRIHRVRLTRYELFDSVLGKVPAARIDGIVSKRSGGKGKRYTVWISDDGRRVPLRMEVPTKHGPVSLDLVEYDAPDRRP